MSLRAKAFGREHMRLRSRLRKMSLRAKAFGAKTSVCALGCAQMSLRTTAFGRENERLRARLRTNEFAR